MDGEGTRHYVEDLCLDSIVPHGETIDDLSSLDTFTITGRGIVYVVLPMWNRKALRGRTINIDGVARKVAGVESCLVLGHDEGYCEHATGILVND